MNRVEKINQLRTMAELLGHVLADAEDGWIQCGKCREFAYLGCTGEFDEEPYVGYAAVLRCGEAYAQGHYDVKVEAVESWFRDYKGPSDETSI